MRLRQRGALSAGNWPGYATPNFRGKWTTDARLAPVGQATTSRTAAPKRLWASSSAFWKGRRFGATSETRHARDGWQCDRPRAKCGKCRGAMSMAPIDLYLNASPHPRPVHRMPSRASLDPTPAAGRADHPPPGIGNADVIGDRRRAHVARVAAGEACRGQRAHAELRMLPIVIGGPS